MSDLVMVDTSHETSGKDLAYSIILLTELWIYIYAATTSQLSQLTNQMTSQFYSIMFLAQQGTVADSLWFGYDNTTEADKQSHR